MKKVCKHCKNAIHNVPREDWGDYCQPFGSCEAEWVADAWEESPPTLKSVPAPPALKDTNPKDAAAQDRIPLGLCSPIAKAHWALAQFAGMVKYGAWNWRKAGVRNSVYIHAIQRHLDAYASGEEVDPIDGTHHLGNIMAGCAIILDAAEAGKLTDDRAPRIDVRRTYGALQELARKLIKQYAHKKPRHYTIADSEQSGENGDVGR